MSNPFILLFVGLALLAPVDASLAERSAMPKSAEDYIAAFHRGEDFRAPARGVFAGNQPDRPAVRRLGQELAASDGAVRENLVLLLVDMGLRGDPLTAQGAEALRDPDIIARFIAQATAAEAAADGAALAEALATLGLIGTRTSLVEIARRLRTPLTLEVPDAFEKSVRLSALEALLYNFPDQPVLYPARIIHASDYTAAERFCTQTLGVSWSEPPPPFLTYRGYPISHRPGQPVDDTFGVAQFQPL